LTLTAFFDANVLYPAPLRDLLLWLTLTGLFRARWSDKVHEEWIEALLRNRPDLARERLERTRALMDESVQDCLVQDFEALIPAIILPDENDRHVLAAAIRARADIIVTRNLDDFPTATLDRFGIRPHHPDEFVAHLLDLDPDSVVAAASQHRQGLRRPPRSVDEYLHTLVDQGLTHSVAILKKYRDCL